MPTSSHTCARGLRTVLLQNPYSARIAHARMHALTCGKVRPNGREVRASSAPTPTAPRCLHSARGSCTGPSRGGAWSAKSIGGWPIPAGDGLRKSGDTTYHPSLCVLRKLVLCPVCTRGRGPHLGPPVPRKMPRSRRGQYHHPALGPPAVMWALGMTAVGYSWGGA